jgi:23S rRNA (pseudouridine1915-N3)-methyltransferase
LGKGRPGHLRVQAKALYTLSIVEIPELKNVSALSKDQIKIREGELILKNVRPTDDVILMDERGKQYTSVELARVL